MAATNALVWWHNYIGYDSEVDDQFVQIVWDAATKSVEACQPATNTGSPKLPTRADFIAWLSTFESAPSACSVYDWLCRKLQTDA